MEISPLARVGTGAGDGFATSGDRPKIYSFALVMPSPSGSAEGPVMSGLFTLVGGKMLFPQVVKGSMMVAVAAEESAVPAEFDARTQQLTLAVSGAVVKEVNAADAALVTGFEVSPVFPTNH